MGGWTGVTRLVFQADIAAGKMTALAAGKFVPVASPPTFKPGLRFAGDLSGAPMTFCGGSPISGQQSDYQELDAGFAFTLLGAKLSSVIKYSPGSTGSAAVPGSPAIPATATTAAAPAVIAKPAIQVALPVLPTTDFNSYQKLEANILALLPLSDDPAYVLSSRIIATSNGAPGTSDTGAAFLLDPGAGNPYCTVSGFSLRDITVQGGHLGYGLMTANSGTCNLSNVSIMGGAVGWGNLSLGSNYTYYLSGRNLFKASAYPINLYYSIVRAEGVLQISNFGYGAVRVQTGDFRCNDLEVLCEVSQYCRDVVFVEGTFVVRSMMVDNEAMSVPLPAMLSAVRCNMAQGVGRAVCRVDDLVVAQLGPNAAAIVLGSAIPASDTAHASLIPGGQFVLGNATVQGGPKALGVVRVSDPRWRGTVDAQMVGPTNGGAAGMPVVVVDQGVVTAGGSGVVRGQGVTGVAPVVVPVMP